MRTRTLVAAVVAGTAAAVGFSSDGQAGYSSSTEYCTKQSNGSGYCEGTYGGFRNGGGSSDYFFFNTQASGTSPAYQYFGAELGNTWYSCTVTSSNSSVAAAWPQSVDPTAFFFYIAWDANGNCNSIEINRGSPY